jgi:hypothetical protein
MYINIFIILIKIEQMKSNNIQQTSPTSTGTSTVGAPTSSPRHRQHKHNSNKHVLVSSTSKH